MYDARPRPAATMGGSGQPGAARVLLLGLLAATFMLACSTPHRAHAEDTAMPAETAVQPSANARGSELGVPLGTIVHLEGVMFDGTETRTKALDGVSLIEVHAVNGVALPAPARLRFEPFVGTTFLAPDHGQPVRVVAYETGAYQGVPDGVFEYVAAVTATGFGFETWLVVLTEEAP